MDRCLFWLTRLCVVCRQPRRPRGSRPRPASRFRPSAGRAATPCTRFDQHFGSLLEAAPEIGTDRLREWVVSAAFAVPFLVHQPHQPPGGATPPRPGILTEPALV